MNKKIERELANFLKEFQDEYPTINMEGVMYGHVTSVNSHSYSVVLESLDAEDVTCDIFKNYFPDGQVQEGTIFFLGYGDESTDTPFTKIKLCKKVWTPEMLEKINELILEHSFSFVKLDYHHHQFQAQHQ